MNFIRLDKFRINPEKITCYYEEERDGKIITVVELDSCKENVSRIEVEMKVGQLDISLWTRK